MLLTLISRKVETHNNHCNHDDSDTNNNISTKMNSCCSASCFPLMPPQDEARVEGWWWGLLKGAGGGYCYRVLETHEWGPSVVCCVIGGGCGVGGMCTVIRRAHACCLYMLYADCKSAHVFWYMYQTCSGMLLVVFTIWQLYSLCCRHDD